VQERPQCPVATKAEQVKQTLSACVLYSTLCSGRV
jgi:hypothetical protein